MFKILNGNGTSALVTFALFQSLIIFEFTADAHF